MGKNQSSKQGKQEIILKNKKPVIPKKIRAKAPIKKILATCALIGQEVVGKFYNGTLVKHPWLSLANKGIDLVGKTHVLKPKEVSNKDATQLFGLTRRLKRKVSQEGKFLQKKTKIKIKQFITIFEDELERIA